MSILFLSISDYSRYTLTHTKLNKREGDRESSYEKIIQNTDTKDDPKYENKMDLQINRLETRFEKMQEMFNKDIEEIKKSE